MVWFQARCALLKLLGRGGRPPEDWRTVRTRTHPYAPIRRRQWRCCCCTHHGPVLQLPHGAILWLPVDPHARAVAPLLPDAQVHQGRRAGGWRALLYLRGDRDVSGAAASALQQRVGDDRGAWWYRQRVEHARGHAKHDQRESCCTDGTLLRRAVDAATGSAAAAAAADTPMPPLPTVRADVQDGSCGGIHERAHRDPHHRLALRRRRQPHSSHSVLDARRSAIPAPEWAVWVRAAPDRLSLCRRAYVAQFRARVCGRGQLARFVSASAAWRGGPLE